jgi:peptidoglycan/xylan/chitin deacetylase (PgdA/CDA1 family)
MSLKIHIADDLPGRHIIYYTLQLIAANKGIEFSYTHIPSEADFKIDASEYSDIILENTFYQNLTSGKPVSAKSELTYRYRYQWPDSKSDFLAAIFYLVNCLQEHHITNFDKYGRFPYNDSIQKKEGLLQTNLVQGLIDELFRSHPKLSKLQTTKRKSGFFITHDIDTIYGAKNQNGDHALKTHQYHKIPKLLWNHYVGRPDWLNMDKIMAMEEQYGFTSTFYWLVRKDKENADYYIKSELIQNQLAQIEARGFEIGLHKSLRDSSLSEEMKLLDKNIRGQRYHFLKFNLPKAWEELEAARLKLDSSLGFSEDFGFRNSYGLPFMPFNIKEQHVYNLIEVPMNVMDGNFFYQNKTVVQAEKELIDWLDRNKENVIFTLNFHNNFFDNMLYKGYDKLYLTLLQYFKEEDLTCMTQASLIDEFYKPNYYNLKKPIAR